MKIRAKDIIDKIAMPTDPMAGSVRRFIQKRDQFIISQLSMVQKSMAQGDAPSATEKLQWLIAQLQRHSIQGTEE